MLSLSLRGESTPYEVYRVSMLRLVIMVYDDELDSTVLDPQDRLEYPEGPMSI